MDTSELAYIADSKEGAEGIGASLARYVADKDKRDAFLAFSQKQNVVCNPVALRPVERLPDIADVDPAEQDLLRRFCTQMDVYYKSKQIHSMMNVGEGPQAHGQIRVGGRTLQSLETLAQRRARLFADLRREVESADDEMKMLSGETEAAAAPPLAPVTSIEVRAPKTAKDFRPKGTPPPASPLQAHDFGTHCSSKLNVRINKDQMKFNMSGFHRTDVKHPNMPFTVNWPTTLLDDIELVITFTTRRLTRLLQKPDQFCQAVCTRAFDDAVDFLLRDGQIHLKTYTQADRLGWWKARLAANGMTPKTTRTSINCKYERANIETATVWSHRFFTDVYLPGFAAYCVSLSALPPPGVEPPSFDVVLPLGAEPDFLSGKPDDEMIDGFSAADHRRARRWLHYEVTTFYNQIFGTGGWSDVDGITLAEQLTPKLSEAKMLRSELRMRRGAARARNKIARAPFFNWFDSSCGYYSLCLDTRFKFNNACDSFGEAHRARAHVPGHGSNYKAHLSIPGLREPYAESVLRYANYVYFETLSFFAAVDMTAWVATVLRLADAHETIGDLADRHSCAAGSGSSEVHIPDCCSMPTTCDKMRALGSSQTMICSTCYTVLESTLKEIELAELDLPDYIVADIKRRFKDDYALSLSTKTTNPEFEVPSALSVAEAIAARNYNFTHSTNPLFRTVLHERLPISTRLSGGKTSMFSAENLMLMSAGEARLTFAYGHPSTVPLLRHMQKFLGDDHRASSDAFCALRDDKDGTAPFAHTDTLDTIIRHERIIKKIPYWRKDRVKMGVKRVLAIEQEVEQEIAAVEREEKGRARRLKDVVSRPVAAKKMDPVTSRLANIVSEMESTARSDGRRLPRGPDGLPSPFTGETDHQFWTLKKAKAHCSMLVRRTIVYCNRGQTIDDSTGWETHLLNMCRSAAVGGVCPIIGLPFVNSTRSHMRMSMGHIRHGQPMNSGWSAPYPTSFADFSREDCNITGESWAANYYKSNFSGDIIDEHLAHLARGEPAQPTARLTNLYEDLYDEITRRPATRRAAANRRAAADPTSRKSLMKLYERLNDQINGTEMARREM